MTLRLRVLFLVFLINAGLFGAGGVFVFREQVELSKAEVQGRTDDLLYTLKGTFRPETKINVAYFLRLLFWESVDDAILVDDQIYRVENGDVYTPGVSLNPVGAARRPIDFDRQAALSAILTAMETGAPVEEVEAGRAVPIEGTGGIWGGLWYRPGEGVDYAKLIRSMLLWFLASTLLLTAGTFFALRRLVLDPVAQLAGGARRVRAGDFEVRLAEPDRRDELSDLMRSFNAMTSTVQEFNELLEDKVRMATEKARKAEAAAMTQRRLAAMGELAAGIAHEINNPLGGLRNAVERLERGDLPNEKREQYLQLLDRGLERIGETVNRLRRFTPRDAPLEEVDLTAIARDSIELVRHRAERLGVALHLAAEGEHVVRGPRNELGQALLNLIVNSLDALEEHGTRDPEGARVLVRILRRSHGTRLEVVDNGPGVSPEELERVPDLFYTTKEVGKGTGLGLALVHNTLAKIGGSVRFDSRPGESFSAELWFPAGP